MQLHIFLQQAHVVGLIPQAGGGAAHPQAAAHLLIHTLPQFQQLAQQGVVDLVVMEEGALFIAVVPLQVA